MQIICVTHFESRNSATHVSVDWFVRSPAPTSLPAPFVHPFGLSTVARKFMLICTFRNGTAAQLHTRTHTHIWYLNPSRTWPKYTNSHAALHAKQSWESCQRFQLWYVWNLPSPISSIFNLPSWECRCCLFWHLIKRNHRFVDAEIFYSFRSGFCLSGLRHKLHLIAPGGDRTPIRVATNRLGPASIFKFMAHLKLIQFCLMPLSQPPGRRPWISWISPHIQICFICCHIAV